MGLFDLFGKKSNSNKVEESTKVPWEVLDQRKQLDEIEQASYEQPVLIFKHSTRCGVSRMVLRHFENSFDLPQDAIKVYYLDLLAHRDLSDAVAIDFQVIHQSPQILVIKNGRTIHHASHHTIQTHDLEIFLN